MLGDIHGLTVLDAFAGSGAMSYEAISRGAQHAMLIELDKGAFTTIKENVELLGLEDHITAVRGNIKGWSNNNLDKQYDIVICDPPYDAVLEMLIHKISRHVARGGTLLVSWPTSEPTPVIPDMELTRHKVYGNAQVVAYKKPSS